ncbi:flagellar basal body protein [Paenibacillus sp. P26]|nr:flagellar basal body protein [Paenibacillus sp. P26]
MLRGLYTAASGMIAQQRKHDIVTNNIANINTPGFKSGARYRPLFSRNSYFAYP